VVSIGNIIETIAILIVGFGLIDAIHHDQRMQINYKKWEGGENLSGHPNEHENALRSAARVVLRVAARVALLILSVPARWLTHFYETVISKKGYLAIGSVLAAYLVVFGLVDAKSTQEETRASLERSLFITLVSSGGNASFVSAMKDFGRIQTMPTTEHPSLWRFWEWYRTYQPNREPMRRWASWRLGLCNKESKDCSLGNETRLDLGYANLSDANLGFANLSDASLVYANLISANLSHALLSEANLSEANLGFANLSDASLVYANLSGADLGFANLSDASLVYADLSGANLGDARNLTQTQLDKACGDANTKLPEGLTVKPCPTSEPPKAP
jgi:hypothetical protein